jgi:hypothetical protein
MDTYKYVKINTTYGPTCREAHKHAHTPRTLQLAKYQYPYGPGDPAVGLFLFLYAR